MVGCIHHHDQHTRTLTPTTFTSTHPAHNVRWRHATRRPSPPTTTTTTTPEPGRRRHHALDTPQLYNSNQATRSGSTWSVRRPNPEPGRRTSANTRTAHTARAATLENQSVNARVCVCCMSFLGGLALCVCMARARVLKLPIIRHTHTQQRETHQPADNECAMRVTEPMLLMGGCGGIYGVACAVWCLRRCMSVCDAFDLCDSAWWAIIYYSRAR